METSEEIRKLKGKDVKETRLLLLEKQGNICAICRLPCTVDQAVLDHNHVAGYIRAVLHRGCNAVEGKIINAMKRYGIKDHDAFMAGLIAYHKTHSTNQTGLIHPLHKTAEEKAEARKKKALRVRAKAKAAKAAAKLLK